MPPFRLAPALLASAILLPAPADGQAAHGPIASLVRDLNATGNAGGGSSSWPTTESTAGSCG